MSPSLSGNYAAYLEDSDSAPFTSFHGLTRWFKSMEELQRHIAAENEPVDGNHGEDRALAKVRWEGSFEMLCRYEAEAAQSVRAKFYEKLGSELGEEKPVSVIAPELVAKFSEWLESEPMKFGEV